MVRRLVWLALFVCLLSVAMVSAAIASEDVGGRPPVVGALDVSTKSSIR